MQRIDTFHRTVDRARSKRGVALMGICNVTPDSFSDGGRYLAPSAARARVDEILGEGADFVDIGGESTRPGAPSVSAGEQVVRVLDVVRYAVSQGACVSVDTADPKVAAVCLEAGACVVNDVSCLRDDGLASAVAASRGVLLLMHARGTQEQMAGFGRYADDGYGDVVTDVLSEWESAASRASAAGIPRSAMAMDPGLGFAKNSRQSLELLTRVGEVVAALDVPVAVGASRKSFLTLVDPEASASHRLGGSLAAAIHAARSGASILRVHEVRDTRQAIDTARRLGGA